MNRRNRVNRRRTAALSLSAALLGAGPLLTACGSTAHPGAAAVVDGKRIEVSTVQGQVQDVRKAQEATAQGADLVKNTPQLDQSKLNDLIFDRILDRAAAQHGLEVSTREVQQARAADAAQAGGGKQFAALVLQQGALTSAQIDTAVRRDVLMSKLARALGADPSTQEGQKAVQTALSKTSRAMHVDVNPRYGTWDNAKVALGGTRTPWLTQVTGAASAQAAGVPAGA